MDNRSYKVVLQATDLAINYVPDVDNPECACGWTTHFDGGVAPATFGKQPGEMGIGKATMVATKLDSSAKFTLYGR